MFVDFPNGDAVDEFAGLARGKDDLGFDVVPSFLIGEPGRHEQFYGLPAAIYVFSRLSSEFVCPRASGNPRDSSFVNLRGPVRAKHRSAQEKR